MKTTRLIMKLFKVLIGFLEVTAVFCFNARWTKIFVEKSIIDTKDWLFEAFEYSFDSANDLSVIQLISGHSRALLACFWTNNRLLVHGGMISPLYKNQTQDNYTCYTKMNKDYVFGSTITGIRPITGGRTYQNWS